ncbi:hypothetical protein EVAR_42802_1 [Eumeta japonica]|uniref:Uncharacterized protein n=1 Tax=Eumeta variegata TaxID=151549 RepID=A0A4C1WG41_EUMVA|nr:hypothetical protein EVAR_42802_1 [Eumeta japonica]
MFCVLFVDPYISQQRTRAVARRVLGALSRLTSRNSAVPNEIIKLAELNSYRCAAPAPNATTSDLDILQAVNSQTATHTSESGVVRSQACETNALTRENLKVSCVSVNNASAGPRRLSRHLHRRARCREGGARRTRRHPGAGVRG